MVDIVVETDREQDGRWTAEVPSLPGVLAYGHSLDQAVALAKSLALRVLADRLDHGEEVPDLSNLFVVAA